jgi:thiamine pyrophosphokinase
MEFTPSLQITGCSNEDCILIILNCPLRFTPKFHNIWVKSKYKICADGGANRLFDLFDEVSRPLYVSYPCHAMVAELTSLH